MVGMTAGSPNVTDPNAVAGDVGLNINSTNFAGSSAVIQSITSSPTGYVVSKNATATLSSQTCLIGDKGLNKGVTFDKVTFEVCAGGGIAMTGCYGILINDCDNWDIAGAGLKANFYNFTNGKNGYTCCRIQIKGGMAGGDATIGSGFSDFYADSTCQNIYIESYGSAKFSDYPPIISSPAAQTTIINPSVVGGPAAPVSAFPGPVAVTGTVGAAAGGRYVGATASGAPSTGTFLAGDFANDQAGNFWLYNGSTWTGGAQAAPPPPPTSVVHRQRHLGETGRRENGVCLRDPRRIGGGSGASGASGTVLCGGGGGGAGMLIQRQFVASDLPATVTVTAGAAGAGGAAVTGMTPRVDTTAGGTNTTTTVTDANAVAGDLGRSISGTDIPANAYITAVNAGVGYTISAAATGGVTSSITFTIGT